ncbi:cytochrome P450 [Desarmillaria ectypa]|nr:cytochrome P450 [Desarmillaria ectypa]
MLVIEIAAGITSALTLTVLSFVLLRKPVSAVKFPPGPTGFPIAGCAFLMPTQNEHKTFCRWAEDFGRIVGLRIFGKKIVLLNTSEVASKLLNMRGSVYSNRPRFPMLEMMAFPKWNIGIMNTGDTHRLARQMLGQSLNPKSIQIYHDIMADEIQRLLKYLRDTPSQYSRHLRRSNANTILRMFYGVQPDHVDTEDLVTLNNQLLDAMSLAGAPLAYLVNTFPILKYWPQVLPDLFTIPIVSADGKKNMPFLSMHDSDRAQCDLTRSVAATAFSAGVETSTSILLSFVLAMVLFPDVQHSAQSEIDMKLGGRSPTIKDRFKTLPYVDAILSECYRWAPPGHLGLHHCPSRDDIFDGYLLPGSAVVLPNIWNILHDPSLYRDSMDFVPERFLGPNPEPDPREHVYGYGRRICPGRYLAEDNLWLGMANMLAIFQFKMAVDADGHPISPVIEFTSGVMNRPRDFQCLIEPHSPEVVTFNSDLS